MTRAGSLEDQLISNAKYRRRIDPYRGGGELDQNKQKRLE